MNPVDVVIVWDAITKNSKISVETISIYDDYNHVYTVVADC